MLGKHKYKLVAGALLMALVWFGWPVYQFFAYNGHVPLPSYGLMPVPATGPSGQTLLNARYQTAGQQALQALVEHKVAIGAPGISAAIAIDGALVWTGTAGWADIRTSRPVTPETQFRIGSTSKPLTATGLALLVQSGHIDLDTSLESYFEKYAHKLPNAEWQKITPRQLASHMAGLPEYKQNRDWSGLYHTMALKRHYDNVFESLDVFDNSPLLFQPGAQFNYTSFGTVLLSAVMATATDQPYLDLMQGSVFTPLGMTSTGAEPRTPTGTMATFYWRKNNEVKPWRRVDLSHRLAGGGFISTPTDLVKLGSAWLDPEYLNGAIREHFWQPQVLTNGEVNPRNYALGWRVHAYPLDDQTEVRHINHGGVSRGSQSWLMILPDLNMSVAVMINAKTDEFWDFASVSFDLVDLFSADVEQRSQPDQ